MGGPIDPKVTVLQQAKIAAMAVKTGRMDVLTTMTPPAFKKTIKKNELQNALKQSLGPNSKITDATAGPVLSLVEFKGEHFATVATETQIRQDGDLIIIRGYTIGVSSDGGRKWKFINGSDRMKLKTIDYLKTSRKKLIYPTRKMIIDDFVWIRENGKWVPDSATMNKMKNLLRKATTTN